MELHLLTIISLLIISAILACSETAIIAASRAKIHHLAQSGNKNAKKVEKLLNKRERIISVIVVGNNILNILISVLTTSLLIDVFGDNGTIYATAILTVIIIVFGEILPKTLAMKSPSIIAVKLALIIEIATKILLPITNVAQKIVDTVILSIFGKPKKHSKQAELEEIRETVALKHKEGSIIKYDKELLEGVLDLSDTEISEIIVHRRDMESLNGDLPTEQIIKLVLELNHTHIPLWRGNKENIIAILNVRKMLKLLHKHQKNGGKAKDFQISGALSEPWFIPSTNSLRAQLFAFRKKRKRFALVIDEYGSLLGLVTISDIIEEIVGEIKEQDDDDFNIIKTKSGAYKIIGKTLIRDINKQLDWDIPDDDYAYNLSTFIISTLGHIPKEREKFTLNHYQFEIMKKKGNDLLLVKVKKSND